MTFCSCWVGSIIHRKDKNLANMQNDKLKIRLKNMCTKILEINWLSIFVTSECIKHKLSTSLIENFRKSIQLMVLWWTGGIWEWPVPYITFEGITQQNLSIVCIPKLFTTRLKNSTTRTIENYKTNNHYFLNILNNQL